MSKPTDNPSKPSGDRLTTSAGNPIADNQNALSAGPRGPLLLQDYQLIEKLAHQNRERIPERPVHAKGWGAYGTLTISGDISKYTKAKVLQPGARTPLLLRFSTVAGELGAADAERDVRGFAVKFYTEEGNWDLVGNNTPVFFVRDPYKFPDFIHTQKRHPKTNLRSPTAMWDFWSLSPESLHQVTILMSDRGLPTTVRHVNGYGSHTYSLINAAGERVWVKFHFKTRQGHRHWTNAEASAVVGRTRESTQEDLFGAIDRGDFPKWKMQVQIMTDAQAQEWSQRTGWNPFDLTKVWPHGDFPVIDVGTLELNRNADNYFAEIEQAAFAPSNIVPGISFSPDKMLQARVFSLRRCTPLPPRHALRGVAGECATLPGASLPQGRSDAVLRQQHQEPGRLLRAELVNGPKEEKLFAEPPLSLHGDADRYNHRDGNDDYTQPGNLFRLFSAEQRQRLFDNIAAAMHGVPDEIKRRQVALFAKCDPAYGAGVARALKLDRPGEDRLKGTHAAAT